MAKVRECLSTVGMKPIGKEKVAEDAKSKASEEAEEDEMQNTETKTYPQTGVDNTRPRWRQE